MLCTTRWLSNPVNVYLLRAPPQVRVMTACEVRSPLAAVRWVWSPVKIEANVSKLWVVMPSTEKTVVGPIFSLPCPMTPKSGTHGRPQAKRLSPRLKRKSVGRLITLSHTQVKPHSHVHSSCLERMVCSPFTAPHRAIVLLSWAKLGPQPPPHNSQKRGCGQVSRCSWSTAPGPRTVLLTQSRSKLSKLGVSAVRKWRYWSTQSHSASPLRPLALVLK